MLMISDKIIAALFVFAAQQSLKRTTNLRHVGRLFANTPKLIIGADNQLLSGNGN